MQASKRNMLGLLFWVVLPAAIILTACGGKENIAPKVETPSRSLTDHEKKNNRAAVVKGPTKRESDTLNHSRQAIEPTSKMSVRSDVVASPHPQVTGAGAPKIKTISGYKTPAEYFVVPSVNYPDGVAVVTLPKDYHRNLRKKYPLVIAFGGAGECARPPYSGALAWLHYYKTDEAIEALQDNELEEADFRGLVLPAHLDEFNQKLRDTPYKGIILVCPSSPPLSYINGGELWGYESYIMQDLIPALKKHYRVAPGRVGVDGVSMGGSRSLYYGFKYPEVFSSIGAIQGAVGPYENLYKNLINRNADKLRKCAIQLVTSDGDYLATSVKKLHRFLLAKKIPHRYYMLTGPHDYIFNQGPGSIALLVFHNEALNGKRSGPVR